MGQPLDYQVPVDYDAMVDDLDAISDSVPTDAPRVLEADYLVDTLMAVGESH